MSYASLYLLKARLGSDAQDTSQDAILQVSLDWADAFIEATTHRWFEARSQTRFYGPDALDTSPLPFTPRGTDAADDPLLRRSGWSSWPYRRLYLDHDLLTISAITNGDGTALPADAYYAEPRNETPAYAIWLKSAYAWTWDTDGWVAVTGDWGASAEPSPLIVGCALKLAEWHWRSKAPLVSTNVLSGSSKTVPEGFPVDVPLALQPFTRLAR